MKLSPEAHGLILLQVASRTLRDARAAWRRARDSTDEHVLRAAYQACMLAAHAMRDAVYAPGNDSAETRRIHAQMKRIDDAADELKTRLVRATI